MDAQLLLRAVFALFFVLGLVGLLAWGLRRSPELLAALRGIKRAGRLSVLERLSLDARRQIVIVSDGVDELVLLLGSAGEQVLARRPAPTPAPAPAPLLDRAA